MKVAIVGASGAVGRTLLQVLAQRNFPVTELRGFSSPRSRGKSFEFGGQSKALQILEPGCFNGIQFAFFDASDAVSREWVPEAAKAGAWVVDNSGAFRMEPDVPLLVPEVNGHLIRARAMRTGSLTPRERILAGPNCSTVQLTLPLQVLQTGWGLRRVVVSTYQSTSGAGTRAIDELNQQVRARLDGKSGIREVFPREIAFNTIPQVGGLNQEGDSSEEVKIVEESRKILGLPHLRISATAVRVPTWIGHSESVNVELERGFDLEEVRSALKSFPGISISAGHDTYPTATDFAGRDEVAVGRLRRDPTVDHGLNFWVVSDNLRKGAALNAVQIGETILEAGGRSA